jgi:hypothetical protein
MFWQGDNGCYVGAHAHPVPPPSWREVGTARRPARCRWTPSCPWRAQPLTKMSASAPTLPCARVAAKHFLVVCKQQHTTHNTHTNTLSNTPAQCAQRLKSASPAVLLVAHSRTPQIPGAECDRRGSGSAAQKGLAALVVARQHWQTHCPHTTLFPHFSFRGKATTVLSSGAEERTSYRLVWQ